MTRAALVDTLRLAVLVPLGLALAAAAVAVFAVLRWDDRRLARQAARRRRLRAAWPCPGSRGLPARS